MSELVFGLDFGTTNSLTALVVGNEVRSLTDDADKPHPSVVWYRGGDAVVGREARQHIETLQSGVEHGFVRSPKMMLRREGPVHIQGRAVDPTDIVAEVLGHLQSDAASRQEQSYDIARAVMTVPVDFAGSQRRALRSAARKAGISVLQFVHEPAAALYAHIRSKPDLNRELAKLENRVVLVFDWGGGTLDLTACRILGGVVMQISNRGNNEIGGDVFDERLRNLIRGKHAKIHKLDDVTATEQPGASASLLTQCENAKIELSNREEFTVYAKDYLRSDGSDRNLEVDLSRDELESLSNDLVNRGLAEIDRLLDDARLERNDIELCIATGGMVNMPAIWNGLVERFGARVPALPNRDRIIAEGAAWIAHDGLRLTLAKPIEVLVSNGNGRGAYLPLVEAGLRLPVENETVATSNKRFYSIDPRDGVATFEFAKPRKVGLLLPNDDRTMLGAMNLPIDPEAQPFLERLECQIQIDHDYIAHVSLKSLGRASLVESEFHDLDFGLALPLESKIEDDGFDEETIGNTDPHSASSGGTSLRSNISTFENWKLVPGDIVTRWKSGFLNATSNEATNTQRIENMYYRPCVKCHRTSYQITKEGPIELCRQVNCSEATS